MAKTGPETGLLYDGNFRPVEETASCPTRPTPIPAAPAHPTRTHRGPCGPHHLQHRRPAARSRSPSRLRGRRRQRSTRRRGRIPHEHPGVSRGPDPDPFPVRPPAFPARGIRTRLRCSSVHDPIPNRVSFPAFLGIIRPGMALLFPEPPRTPLRAPPAAAVHPCPAHPSFSRRLEAI